jgi:uncharacterized membrane protein YcaP (DUF421 family)
MMVNWRELFVPSGSLLELFIRGTVMYFMLLAVLRVLVRRHVGSMSLMDLLMMVLIADAAQNALAGEYRSISEGIVLCGTLIGWNYALDWLAYQSPAVAKLLEPPPLKVVRDGKLLRRNMRTEFITEDELMSQLRQQGITEIASVKYAQVEPDGGISVERNDGGGNAPTNPQEKNSSLF